MDKGRSILFNSAMVRALLAETKTQTRRLMKPQPSPDWAPRSWGEVHRMRDGEFVMRRGSPVVIGHGPSNDDGDEAYPCPYGMIGDRLLVKEAAWMWCERRPNGTTKTGRLKYHYVALQHVPPYYCADHPARPLTEISHEKTGNQWGWHKKIGRFLPRWASRITMEITDLRVQRLQEISEADAVAEGIEHCGGWYMAPGIDGTGHRVPEPQSTASSAFALLWESINGADSWDLNQWVWAITFKRVEATNA